MYTVEYVVLQLDYQPHESVSHPLRICDCPCEELGFEVNHMMESTMNEPQVLELPTSNLKTNPIECHQNFVIIVRHATFENVVMTQECLFVS